MKISSKTTTVVHLEAYARQERRSRSSSENKIFRLAGSSVDIVDFLQKPSEGCRMLREMPHVRAGEVAEIRAAIDNGTYAVDANRVAGAMLREAFENNLILNTIDLRV